MEVTKHCGGCNTTKAIDEFNVDKHEKDGHSYTCKICRRLTQKKWRTKNPDKVKALNLRKKIKRDIYYRDPLMKLKYRKRYIEKQFNISYDLYEEMEKKQNNLCAVCNLPQRDTRYKYLCVDHDHTTGEVRGLLCGPCNRGLGHLLDDPIVVANALNYLLKYRKNEHSGNQS